MGRLDRFKPVRVVVAVALIVGLGAFLWTKAVAPNLFPKNFGVVDEGKVYRSGELTPAAFKLLRERHGIKTIIDLGTHEPGTADENREKRTAELLGISRHVFNLEGDSTGNPNEYVEALRLMTDPANQPVLVHCGAGSERTGMAVVLYRHITQDTPIDEAYKECSEFHHDPKRNPHLPEMLHEWGDKITEAYKSGTAIAWPR